MGQQNQGHNLLVMTNNDVYYLTADAAKALMSLITSHGQEPLSFFETVDAKSGARVAIRLANVSSIVIPREGK